MKNILTLFLSLLFVFNVFGSSLEMYQSKIDSIGGAEGSLKGAIVSTVLTNSISQPILIAVGSFSLPTLIAVGAFVVATGITLGAIELHKLAYIKVVNLYIQALENKGRSLERLSRKFSRKFKMNVTQEVLAEIIIELFEDDSRVSQFVVKKGKNRLLNYVKFKKAIEKDIRNME